MLGYTGGDYYKELAGLVFVYICIDYWCMVWVGTVIGYIGTIAEWCGLVTGCAVYSDAVGCNINGRDCTSVAALSLFVMIVVVAYLSGSIIDTSFGSSFVNAVSYTLVLCLPWPVSWFLFVLTGVYALFLSLNKFLICCSYSPNVKLK